MQHAPCCDAAGAAERERAIGCDGVINNANAARAEARAIKREIFPSAHAGRCTQEAQV